MRLYTHGYIQDKFSQLITDSAFDGMHESKNPRTRDMLKQMIEGACSDCDLIGERVVSAVYRILVVFLPYTSYRVGVFDIPTENFWVVKLLMDGDLTVPILQMEIMAN